MDPGTQLGPYEIKEPLGKGGMGEVYRAHDPNLRRDVAIKLLPQELAADEKRLGRLKREARSLAALNHPHIATVHGFEEHDGTSFIVMELVEGETLAERLEDGPLPVEETLDTAAQIARALEAAHARGIVHRDLKPSNVKITPSGEVKVLDFGLAKPIEEKGAGISESELPTATVEGTRTGVIVGTVPYMSPEQARGEEVDGRSDIWAFGCLLYEMLTGRRAFAADTPSEALAAVLTREPEWGGLPASLDPMVCALLRRCLRKDPDRRLHHIADVRIELEEVLERGDEFTLPEQRRSMEEPFWRRVLPWTIAAVLAIALVMQFYQPRRIDQSRAAAFHIQVATDEAPLPGLGPSMVLSPSGDRLAIVTGRPPDTRLYVRSLDQLVSTPLPGTEGARDPFFSPDGRWIGFFTRDSLKKIAVTGGAPITLCEVESDSLGGTWSERGTIVFALSSTSGLARIPATGGVPEMITTPDKEQEGNAHAWPQFLPGGEALIFVGGQSGAYVDSRIMGLTLETGEVRMIHRGPIYPRFLSSGHLVYIDEETLFAARFDPDRLEMLGSPVPVLEGVVASRDSAGAQYSVSDNGTLIYLAGTRPGFENTVHWASSGGELSPLVEEPGTYVYPALSPDGDRLALTVGFPTYEADIWVRNLRRNTMSRLTFDAAGNMSPVWSPDGRWLAYSAEADHWALRVKRADGLGEAKRLSKGSSPFVPMDWSPDGRTLVGVDPEGPAGAWDLHLLHLPEGFLEEGSPEPVDSEPFLESEFDKIFAAFSPDGRWIAYESNESGRYEIYVRPFRRGGGKWQVSTDGGHFPIWSRDGTELFYLADDRIMAVPYANEGGTFSVGNSRSVVELPFSPLDATSGFFFSRLDVAPGGGRFVVLRSAAEERPEEKMRPTVVLNWFQELERQVPTGR